MKPLSRERGFFLFLQNEYMTKLYTDSYLPKLLETETTIAVRKGVLLENHSKILKELKDITRL